MKRLNPALLIIACAVFFASCNSERPDVLIDPAYEFKTTGLFHVTKIEQTPDETILTVKSTFIPHWWVKFGADTFIEDAETGERLILTSMENGEIGREIYMPDSGDSTFILHFPPLAEGVRSINWGEEGKVDIYGISLVEQGAADTKSVVPRKVTRWINRELKKSRRKTVWDLTPETFFEEGTARVVGYIKGYDPRAGFSTAVVYCTNEITGEDFPRVVEVHPDGRFEVDLPVFYPQRQTIYFSTPRMTLPVYVEPSQTLGVVLDWEDFLYADRNRNRPPELRTIEYFGPASLINSELAAYKDPNADWNTFSRQYRELGPAEYKAQALAKWDADIAELERYAADNNLLPQSKAVLRADIECVNAEYLFSYIMYRSYEQTEAAKLPVPDDFYDFMRRMDLDDPTLLTSANSNIFLNRFEFSDIFRGVNRPWSSGMPPFENYLVDSLGRDSSVREVADIVAVFDKIQKMSETVEFSEVLAYANSPEATAVRDALIDKYRDEYERYETRRDAAEKAALLKEEIGVMDRRDSVYRSRFGSDGSLIWDIAKSRRASYIFQQPEDVSSKYLATLKEHITDGFVVSQLDALYNDTFGDTSPETIPDNTAGRIFRKIIEPFRGKVLFVDFWGVYCGPCIYGIEQSVDFRARHADNPDAAFLFITSEDDSPLDQYNEIVEKNGMEHSFRISGDDYLYLRELFRFNGIPRYVMIDREGRIADRDMGAPYHEEDLKINIRKADGEAI